MESTPLLYQTLVQILGCHQNWLDIRHVKTLAWMIHGFNAMKIRGSGDQFFA